MLIPELLLFFISFLLTHHKKVPNFYAVTINLLKIANDSEEEGERVRSRQSRAY